MTTPTLIEILEKVVALEDKASEAQTNAETQQSSDNSWVGALVAWLVGLLLAAGVAIGAFFLLQDLKKKNEELARLRTQTEQDELRKASLEHEAGVATHVNRAAELRAEAIALEEDIENRKQVISARQSAYDTLTERVLAARDWKELDALNEEGR